MKKVSVCFVCLGNICRSPTAEAVMLRLIDEAGLAERVEIDSAGTGDWHIGEAPDERAQRAGGLRGYELAPLRARQIAAEDFRRFDLIVAMDDANVAALQGVCPANERDKIRLLMEFAPQAETRVVVDPYFGGDAGFETVLDQCEAACAGLLATLRPQLAD
ncbi:low molecular weight phosphotyrosine protein phosphatase [Paraburkholderia sp. CNPSo 3076]|uniref:low molecular weight protein-tyrosine-phosphatase n=1 Tax=Paraburkholderia sp. CNPSo 3076 TaxID=2940936 RepID=UPI002254B587|nr:low molecular weight protein-tyrosine-phosphatase [Paraburkholderia sp. CNPSo 3076]MCX5538528.1 low molecular weight phosphotyrosine protein phosphatase [Paraburkholderia sp. CNPSo 3076]